MAVFRGLNQADLIGRPLDERTYLSTNVQTADVNTYDPTTFAIPDALQGSYAQRFLPAVHTNFPAIINASVNTPFYQGVYFQQDAVIVNQTGYDIGLLGEDQTTFFDLFVTFSFKSTVESIGIVDTGAGITVSGLAVSDEFYPYEEKSVGLIVALDGPASIDTQFYIKFEEDPTTYYMDILGSRIGQFYVKTPNWQDGVSVERRFLTSVFTSQNMTESRKVLRDKPVRSMQATVPFFDKFGAGNMWATLRDFSSRQTAQPWYPDQSSMTQASTVNRVYCATEYRAFQEGGYAFLVHDSNVDENSFYELVRVLTIFADGFATDDDVSGSYILGDKVYPAFICMASLEGMEQALMTDDKATVEIVAEEVYGPNILDVENSGYTPDTRNGYPVLTLTTTFSEAPSIRVLSGGESKDSGRGVAQIIKGVPYVTQQVTAICKSKEECWEAIGFFNYLQGRGNAFWARSEVDFMSVLSTSGTTSFIIDNPLTVVDMEYLTYCWVEDSTGAYDIIAVTDRTSVTGGIEIALDTNSLADINKVWQAHAVRLAEDVITEEYLTDSVMLSTFTVQELQGI